MSKQNKQLDDTFYLNCCLNYKALSGKCVDIAPSSVNGEKTLVNVTGSGVIRRLRLGSEYLKIKIYMDGKLTMNSYISKGHDLYFGSYSGESKIFNLSDDGGQKHGSLSILPIFYKSLKIVVVRAAVGSIAATDPYYIDYCIGGSAIS